jgi:uncharacterized coiled-coil protein SlyX
MTAQTEVVATSQELQFGLNAELDMRQSAEDLARLGPDEIRYQLDDRLEELEEQKSANDQRHSKLLVQLNTESSKVVDKYKHKEMEALAVLKSKIFGRKHKVWYTGSVGDDAVEKQEIAVQIQVSTDSGESSLSRGNSSYCDTLHVKVPFNAKMKDLVSEIKDSIKVATTINNEKSEINKMQPKLKKLGERIRHEVAKAQAAGKIKKQQDVWDIISRLDDDVMPRSLRPMLKKANIRALALTVAK